MADIGILRSIKIGTNIRGNSSLICDVEIDDPYDIQTVDFLFEPGNFSIPEIGSEILIHEISPDQKVATAVDSGIIMAMLPNGEKKLFSTKSNEISALIHLKTTGEIVLNESPSTAMRFPEFESVWKSLVLRIQTIEASLKPPIGPYAPDPLADISKANSTKVFL